MINHICRMGITACSLLTFAITGCSKSNNDGGVKVPPRADFSFSIGSNQALPVSVAFTSTSKNAVRYFWDFGDGTFDSTAEVNHIYRRGGSMKVKLVVSNEAGKDSVMKELGIVGDGQPPLVWQEDWLEHRQLLKRMYFNDNVAVYYDNDVNKDVSWPFQFFDKVWSYTKQVYGDFGKNLGVDDRLYVVLHTDKYGGGHPAAYFDASHHYRNTIDLGAGGGSSAWTQQAGWNIGASVHEISHIVEGASHAVKESPAFDIWGDSKWAEIFVYDVYKSLNFTAEANETRDECMNISDTYPVAGSQWFRDWFYPIYSNYGGATALAKYFQLLAQYFPKQKFTNDIQVFTRRMNMGEFIHFYSGAAGANLQPLAAKAFGWKTEWTTQLAAAKTNYPNINYTGKADALLIPAADISVGGNAQLTLTRENAGGASATEGSSQLRDGNVDTKFSASFTAGFSFTFQPATTVAVNSYTMASGDGGSDNDPKEWVFEGSDDNSTWNKLDEQKTQWFPGRKQLRRFRFENTKAYKYYRLKVNSNKGSGNIQLSELGIWRTN